MASVEVLDISELLAPIADDQPTGADLRADWSPTSVYYQIKDARAAARAVERQLMHDPEGAANTKPDWNPVLELGPRILRENSKDLEVAAWLIEGLTRRYGFAGLRDGFRLTRLLIEQYWDNLFPLPDEEDGLEARIAPLTGLNGDDGEGTLIAPIANIPLTAGTSVGPYSGWHYEQAAALDGIDDPDRRAQRIADGAVTLEMIDQAVLETPPEFFRDLLEDIQQCEDEYALLCEVLDEKCGPSYAPPSSNIRNAIAAARETVERIARPVLGGGEEALDESDDEQQEAAVDGAAAVSGGPRKITTRDDAFRTLLQVADFFRRTEPHTPVSYLLEQAVRWGKLPLPELLTELIPDESSRDHLFRLVGIRPPEQESE